MSHRKYSLDTPYIAPYLQLSSNEKSGFILKQKKSILRFHLLKGHLCACVHSQLFILLSSILLHRLHVWRSVLCRWSSYRTTLCSSSSAPP